MMAYSFRITDKELKLSFIYLIISFFFFTIEMLRMRKKTV